MHVLVSLSDYARIYCHMKDSLDKRMMNWKHKLDLYCTLEAELEGDGGIKREREGEEERGRKREEKKGE